MVIRRSMGCLAGLLIAAALTSCSMLPKMGPTGLPPETPTRSRTAQTQVAAQATQPKATQPKKATVPPSGVTATPFQTPKPTLASGCANPYFPVSPNVTWTYAFTSSMGKPHTTTRTLTAITPSSFVVADAIAGDIASAAKWSCKNGDLTMLQSANIKLARAQRRLMPLQRRPPGCFCPPTCRKGKLDRNIWSWSPPRP